MPKNVVVVIRNKLIPPTFRFHSATCSCIVELRRVVNLSRIFPRTGIFRGFSLCLFKRGSEAAIGNGAQSPVLPGNEPRKRVRAEYGLVARPKSSSYTVDAGVSHIGEVASSHKLSGVGRGCSSYSVISVLMVTDLFWI
jgi:hypothetical protein